MACNGGYDRPSPTAIEVLVAVNTFDTDPYRYSPAAVREALALPRGVPVVTCDARAHRSATTVLVSLVEHLIAGAGIESQLAPTHPARSTT